MKFKTAKAEFKFPINTIYLDGYIGSPEIELEPGETLEDAWDAAYERAKAWVEKKRPGNPLLQEIRQEPIPEQQVQNREQVKYEIQATIEACTTLEQLKEYKLLAATSSELTTAYMNKMKSLSV